MTELQPYQQRVVEEQDALAEKLGQLYSFFETSIYANSSRAEQLRLSRQYKIMTLYSDVLSERIETFSEEAS